MIVVVIYLIIAVVFALICKSMAAKRNLNPALWAVLGFFFGLIPVIILAVIGTQNTQPQQQASSGSSLDELAKLKQLLNDGVLTEEEFAAQKSKLLQMD